jgi:hypothetical protein
VKLNGGALAKELTRGFLGYIGYRGRSKGS